VIENVHARRRGRRGRGGGAERDGQRDEGKREPGDDAGLLRAAADDGNAQDLPPRVAAILQIWYEPLGDQRLDGGLRLWERAAAEASAVPTVRPRVTRGGTMKRRFALTVVAAIAVVGTAAAGVGVGGVKMSYRGRTNQHLPIALAIDGSGLISGKYLANYICIRPNGSTARALRQPTTLGRSRFVHARHIDYRETFGGGADEDQTHVVATVSGSKVTGSFNEAYDNRFGILCHSGDVSFSLSH
jgi:hypothetical protein